MAQALTGFGNFSSSGRSSHSDYFCGSQVMLVKNIDFEDVSFYVGMTATVVELREYDLVVRFSHLIERLVQIPKNYFTLVNSSGIDMNIQNIISSYADTGRISIGTQADDVKVQMEKNIESIRDEMRAMVGIPASQLGTFKGLCENTREVEGDWEAKSTKPTETIALVDLEEDDEFSPIEPEILPSIKLK